MKSSIFKPYFHFWVLVLLVSCSEPQSSNSEVVKADARSAPGFSTGKVWVKDTSLYSANFLKELQSMDYPDTIQVIDQFLIIQGDTTPFPEDLQLRKTYQFSASQEDQLYRLSLIRLNATTLKYDFSLYKKDSLLLSDQGQADIGAGFFLAAEGDDDDLTGEGYGAYEYTNRAKEDGLTIRLGIGSDENGKLRARVGWEMIPPDAPTLRTN